MTNGPDLAGRLRAAREQRAEADRQAQQISNCVGRLRRELGEAESREVQAKNNAAEAWSREEIAFAAWHTAELADHEREKAQRQGST